MSLVNEGVLPSGLFSFKPSLSGAKTQHFHKIPLALTDKFHKIPKIPYYVTSIIHKIPKQKVLCEFCFHEIIEPHHIILVITTFLPLMILMPFSEVPRRWPFRLKIPSRTTARQLSSILTLSVVEATCSSPSPESNTSSLIMEMTEGYFSFLIMTTEKHPTPTPTRLKCRCTKALRGGGCLRNTPPTPTPIPTDKGSSIFTRHEGVSLDKRLFCVDSKDGTSSSETFLRRGDVGWVLGGCLNNTHPLSKPLYIGV